MSACEGLKAMNRMTQSDCEELLRSCNHSETLARRVTARRPFECLEDVFSALDSEWMRVSSDEKVEVHKHHARLGEKLGSDGTSSKWTAGEQSKILSGVSDSKASLLELQTLNKEYEAKHGFLFLTKASGKTLEDILTEVRQRILNPTYRELDTAAKQEIMITKSRLTTALEKLTTRSRF
mmetsp:Transcript_10967/g.33648  ORF Transcript_10967/g.33648 Transcript_10967/m.33648 type:complete len:180 (-) Transcript_10967:149-688(-)|eukprot:CAMPEP_0198734432 /NCGR_PEP_ID=MMETSP1475-20131203/52487_1 /TAXON_ID= ORGANISM="Unidentified sp., Strain CCMP1999" /NCGR_SAMPLE_ID=MMETSP1475 /ASSEMBLY_ACC=CAM_ASM_001111 /LENGTH=179 /DNA_ID=CAMNT_0044497903 /DNA_START=166 /DNA_END=705 /DNA_ORIENTATION=-